MRAIFSTTGFIIEFQVAWSILTASAVLRLLGYCCLFFLYGFFLENVYAHVCFHVLPVLFCFVHSKWLPCLTIDSGRTPSRYKHLAEDDVQVDGRRVHFRVLGDFRKEKKAHIFPVLCLGDIGLSMDDLEPLELLAKSDRRVILIDHLGTGESEKLENAPETLSRAELAKLAAEETRAVLENVTFVTPERTVHAFCSGFGMEVAASLASGSMSNVPEGSTSKNIRFASIIVEPSIARRSLPSESLPICAVDAVKRGDSRLLHMHTVASQDSNSSSKSGSASFRKLASSYPTLCLVSKLNAAPAYESVPAERKYIPGPIGLPHLDDNETVLQEVDDFMVKHDRLQ